MSAASVLVVDGDAIPVLGAALLDASWFGQFSWPGNELGVRRVQKGGVIYLLSASADESSHYLIIDAGEAGVFKRAKSANHVLDRILHVALSTFDRNVSIPVGWQPYNSGSKISVYAQPSAVASGQRLYFERNPRGQNQNLYVYAITDSTREFDDVSENIRSYDTAISHLIEALLEPLPAKADDKAMGIVLAAPFGSSFAGGVTLEEWYERKLTAEQRSFVDRGLDRPVRLKGAAGTGKTVSLVVKCLREIYKAEAEGRPFRAAFLTHSASVAHDTVAGMLSSFDPKGRWRHLRHSSIWLGSLYELAQDLLEYEKKGLTPLSADGREGRELQAIMLEDIIDSFRKNTKLFHDSFSACSGDFKDRMTKPAGRRDFIRELLNEFACVVEAENITLGSQKAEKYVSRQRERWQMRLDTAEDRAAVIRIHDEYKKAIRRSGMLSMDQMITDFNKYLSLYEWEKLRSDRGFDIVFVDELHFFNRIERMIFQDLFRWDPAQRADRPLFMSYDLKQSVNEALIGYQEGETASSFFAKVGPGGSDLVELTEVFRYTPEITAFLSDLDAAYPAWDFEAEWGAYNASSQVANGDLPQLRSYQTLTQMLDATFKRAQRDAAALGGKRVAVLAMNEEMFANLLSAGRIVDYHLPITARDQVAELKYSGKRCIFSMPDYVAGLQFEVVYLISVDRADVSDRENIGERRRFVSRVYVGASRAARRLEVASVMERGGASDVFDVPLRRGTLVHSE